MSQMASLAACHHYSLLYKYQLSQMNPRDVVL